MSVVLALDAGTTGVRTIAFDPMGRTVASAYREFPQHFPRPGWVEHDPDDIWQAAQVTLAEVTATVDQPIAAIGITDQRETTVVWDRRTHRPLHRAIVWQDRRTAGRCDELRDAGHLAAVREATGLVLDPYFSGTKLEWLLTEGGVEVTPDLAFGTVDAWLVWNLTGGASHVTDSSNASRTLLYDIGTRAWSAELCDLLGVPAHVLPEVRASSGRVGVTAPDRGLPPGIPISGIAGDQQAALFGQACFAPGEAKNTYGTGSFVLMNVGTTCPPPVEGLLTTIAWSLDDPHGGSATTYAYEGAIFVTGAAVQWLRDGLGIIESASETGPLAESVDDTGGVVVVPAFTGLGSPYWDPYARGTILGITRGTTRAHVARAVVEAMAYQTRDVVDAMSASSGLTVETLQADQLGVPVARPVVHETTALGAAYLAGVAEGVWGSLDDIAANWQIDRRFEPATDRTAAGAGYAQWRRGVERAQAWVPAEHT
jgi:glycerol kinase